MPDDPADTRPHGHITPGGAHAHGDAVSVEEATRLQVELDRAAIAVPGSFAAQREEKRLADLDKLRKRKAKRRAANPYDFR